MAKRVSVFCSCGWKGQRAATTWRKRPCPSCEADNQLTAPALGVTKPGGSPPKGRKRKAPAKAAKGKRRRRGRKPKGQGRPRTPRGLGTRGPPAEPTAAVRARGGRVSKADAEREAAVTPDLPAHVPPPPVYLAGDTYAVEAWRDLSEALHRCGVLTEVDVSVLARYCAVTALWRKCLEDLRDGGHVVDELDGKGKVKARRLNPSARQLKAYGDQLLQLERELGLTPSARVRLRFTFGGPMGGGDDGDDEQDADDGADLYA